MKKVLDEIFAIHKPTPESLIQILQGIQNRFHYLPEECIKEVAIRLAIPLPRVFSVATFYNAFSLKPKGKNIIQVCLGTACHVRGAPRIVEEVERLLGIKNGETTEDGLFSLETVNCLGACALGPIMVVNGEYHGHLSSHKVEAILQECQQG